MVQVSGQNDKFLKKEFLVPKIFEIMNPLLAFVNILPKVQATARTIGYKKETTSDYGDANKEKPRVLTSSSQFTYLTINQMTMKAAVLNKKGFAIKLDQDALDFTEGVDEIQRALRKVGYWLAVDYNDQCTTCMTSEGTTPTWTPTATWNLGTATPVDDLIRLEAQMEREGYAYEMTDVFIHKDNFYELKEYLTSIDITEGKQNSIYGNPTVGKDTCRIPVVGADVHKLKSGLAEGAVLAIDRNNPGATIFYNNSARFGVDTGSYTTIVDGAKKVMPYGFGFNFNRYTDQETHEEVLQFWYDIAPVMIEPYAVLYDTGI